MQQVLLAQVPKHPLPVAGDGYSARTPRDVPQFQDRDFDGPINGHANRQLRNNAVLGMFEYRIAEAMSNDVGRRAACWQRSWRPVVPTLVIPNIKGFPGRVRDRIVVPGVRRNSWEFSAQV